MEDNRKKRFTDLPNVNKKIIEGIPWAQKMWEILENGLDKTFLYWCQLILSMGESEEIIEGWTKIFIDAYEETCCDIVFDMEDLRERVVVKIEQLLQKLQHLCQVLHVEMPVIGYEEQSLCQAQCLLKKRVEEYEQQIEIRKRELDVIRQKELDLCNNLGKVPKVLNDSPLPSAEEIEDFQKHIEKLEAEKFNRLEKFFSIKEDMLAIVQELNVPASSQFEKDVLSADDSAFLVTDSNMRQLDQLHKSLNKQLTAVKEEIRFLRGKVDDYWNLLDLDWKEKQEFSEKYEGNSVNVLEALRKEVKRCEELKRANVKVFIDKLRAELKQLWEKCHCSETAKKQFGFFYSDCYNEDLLALHEVELRKWKNYYEENKELLTLLEKHKRLWNKMVELEESATGPNRYNNRGGQLLKEEKERNKLAKLIPQIEESLLSLSVKYKQHHGKPFTSYGETVNSYISNLHEDRENIKKQKLSARKLQREKSSITPAKSALNIFPSCSYMTPQSATKSTIKRKLVTPQTQDKKPKMVLSERKDNKIRKTPVPENKLAWSTTRAKRLSVERKKRINKIRRISNGSVQKAAANVDDTTFSTDYGAFQNELSTKGNCRSTIISSDVTARNVVPPSIIRIPATPRTPGGKTPTNGKTTPRGNKTPENNNTKLSRAKSHLKLIF